MLKQLDKGIHSSGVLRWYFQRVTGALLLVGLLAHFWVLHFFPPEHGEITFETVMLRLQNPLWKAFDVLFLILAIYHGMNGLVMVIQDYVSRAGWRVFLISLVWVGALYLAVLGSMTILNLA